MDDIDSSKTKLENLTKTAKSILYRNIKNVYDESG